MVNQCCSCGAEMAEGNQVCGACMERSNGIGHSVVVDLTKPPTKAEVIAKFQQLIAELQQIQDAGLVIAAAERMAAMYKVAINEMELIDRLDKKYRAIAEELGEEA